MKTLTLCMGSRKSAKYYLCELSACFSLLLLPCLEVGKVKHPNKVFDKQRMVGKSLYLYQVIETHYYSSFTDKQ